MMMRHSRMACAMLSVCGLASPAAGEPPASPVIQVAVFAPVDEIRRGAAGSDNWPITWGDDGHQYTAYGDGWGFEPKLDRKVSQGFARIEGPPQGFAGINIISPTGETLGDGAAGPKASGMLMVDGVLYLWARNTGNAQLAWSEDRGKTWEWGYTLAESFGCPSFVNFGANYAGARDNYVYTLSLDGDSAYEPADAVVLARAPRERLKERAALEFYAGVDDGGQPRWSADISERHPVLSFPGRCERLDAVYNPGIGRYLMAMGYNHQGGWGLFDAPEPWGPWTCAFTTDDWGLGATHGYRLPAKWIGEDGRTLWMVFSGRDEYDAFCVRRMELELAE